MGSGEFHLLPKLRKADVCSNEVCPCLSPGGCVSVQGLCDAACRGLSRQVEDLSPKDRAGEASWERRLGR